MLLIYDLKKGIIHVSLLQENATVVHRGVYLKNDVEKDLTNILILKTYFSLPTSYLLPDFRFIVKTQWVRVFLFYTIKFIISLISKFIFLKKYLEKDNYFYCLFLVIFVYKFILCGVYNNKISYSLENNVNVEKLKREIFNYKTKIVYYKNNTNLISLELDKLKYMTNFKFVKILSDSESIKFNDSRRVLVTYYSKIFLINDNFEKLLPFHKCYSKKGDFYLYLVSFNKKEQIIIYPDFFNNYNIFSAIFIPYDNNLIENKENLCRIMN